MGRKTLSINFGKMDPHESLRQIEKYNPELHNQDFNLRTEKINLPSPRNSKNNGIHFLKVG